MRNISQFIHRALEKYGIGNESYAAFVCATFGAVVEARFGKPFAVRARAIRFSKGELVVRVTSSTVASEIYTQSDELISLMNKKIHTNDQASLVRRIRFEFGEKESQTQDRY